MTADTTERATPDKVTITVQTVAHPTFDFTFEVGDDETVEEARERAFELARHDAATALAETPHKYDWEEVDFEARHDD